MDTPAISSVSGNFRSVWLIEHRGLSAGQTLALSRCQGSGVNHGPLLFLLRRSGPVSRSRCFLEKAGLMAVEQHVLRWTNMHRFLCAAELEGMATVRTQSH